MRKIINQEPSVGLSGTEGSSISFSASGKITIIKAVIGFWRKKWRGLTLIQGVHGVCTGTISLESGHVEGSKNSSWKLVKTVQYRISNILVGNGKSVILIDSRQLFQNKEPCKLPFVKMTSLSVTMIARDRPHTSPQLTTLCLVFHSTFRS